MEKDFPRPDLLNIKELEKYVKESDLRIIVNKLHKDPFSLVAYNRNNEISFYGWLDYRFPLARLEVLGKDEKTLTKDILEILQK